MIWELGLLFAAAYVFFSYILPYMKLKTFEQEALGEFCMIDIRDYQLSHRNPFNQTTKNIPLSYLPRTTKEEEICEHDIVVVAESKIAAAMAARILKKKTKKFIYYVTVS
ncbi:rhodanese-like domain-containing protein [Pseudalkalibacillus berkeleyi]|uniref:Rhodanese-like domain-containing protein n=1 Tax=Pseudalkalibacillus berkeleyi TaxID=1069813 RepID=A0ABS9H029_9BACL|nr:rhodanese-like domain-containing protein [Pseudalkalibacillus berkeleyi]MCF6138349.1 rhodanese-like domain-containing protein [Pseudalkalibacillus berkeleyi]